MKSIFISQSEVIQAEELVPFLPLATDYLRALFLIQPPPPLAAAQSPPPPSPAPNSGSQNLHTCERHLALMWSLAFYLMENYEHEVPGFNLFSECTIFSFVKSNS